MPDHADAWSNKGVALAKLGRYDEALVALDKALEINPDDADALQLKNQLLSEIHLRVNLRVKSTFDFC